MKETSDHNSIKRMKLLRRERKREQWATAYFFDHHSNVFGLAFI